MISQKEKIDFIYNSNMIEGISYKKSLYNYKNYIKNYDKGFFEITGQIDALNFVIENYKKELTENRILKIHKLLTDDLLDKKNAGQYRKCNVIIGDHYGCFPIEIKPKMKSLIKLLKKVKNYNDCWDFHHEFEIIHPFIDGNGRTGRLILNWLLLKNGFDFEIIKYKNRFDYYNSINNYRFYKILSQEWKN